MSSIFESNRRNRSNRKNSRRPSVLKPVSPALLRWFTWYSRRYISRHFHALRVTREPRPSVDLSRPLVILLNHASWWDPLTVLLIVQHRFPQRRFYAPIDSAALENYGILGRIGMFGVERGTLRGARQFLAASQEVFATSQGGLCVTPQGRFADARERPARFEMGLGHLAARFPEAVFLPLAIEYPFWEERLPEALAQFGDTIDFQGASDPVELTGRLDFALTATQDALCRLSMDRKADDFENLIEGRAGVGGVYDLWRRLQSWSKGEPFVPEHSTIP